ncbi:hypothetical protein EJ06DRAFT_556657 [Trichodelitschia bisporula]|uniref:Uncharacterized protein n=1 Tax=Trichodelitschia bisporula TaxID=703511 RepID=A0A6G1HWW2_9PEZI|nr:hypothetical protein EJ06DRAFT_556657 [Trichodelitschia bisporula]
MSAQPPPSAAYSTPSNPATKDPTESRAAASHHRPSEGDITARRTPPTHEADGQPSALGRGVHGAPPGEEVSGKTEEDVGRHHELDGEQMAMPGEGRVRDAVAGGGGRSGVGGFGEGGVEGGIDRKKEEQKQARDAMKHKRESNADAGGLGQGSGPAELAAGGGGPNNA